MLENYIFPIFSILLQLAILKCIAFAYKAFETKMAKDYDYDYDYGIGMV